MSPDARSRTPRVLLAIHNFDRGGSGRVAGYLARGFAQRGLQVDLVAFASGGEAQDHVAKIVGNTARVRYLGAASGNRPFDLARGIVPLARLLEAEKPDVVIACANNAALAVTSAVKLAGIGDARLYLKTTNPIASSRHSSLLRRVRLASYALIFRRADAVWTLSADESREMRAQFPHFAALFHEVANPYVTPEMLSERSCPPGDPSQGPTIICVARLTAQKRLERLIRAFALVRTPGARLRILGEGEERPALSMLVAQLGLEGRVELPGFVTDVAAQLHAADLFVLPSDYEGLPAVVLEAMATNCKVIATDCFPAARSLLESAPGCGIIERIDPKSMAELIDRHLTGPRPIGLRAIAERYSITNGVASHLAAMMQDERPATPARSLAHAT